MDINISSLYQLQRREGNGVNFYLLGTSQNKLFYADDSASRLSVTSLHAKHTFGSVTDHFSWVTLANKALCYPDGEEPVWTDGDRVYNVGLVKPDAPVSVAENAVGNMQSGDYYVGYSYQRSGDFSYETNVSGETKVTLAEEEKTIDTAFTYSGAAYTDVTSEFNDTASNVQMFVNNDDYVYIGDALKFTELEISLEIEADGDGIAPVFEFSKGSGTWEEFGPIDGTLGMLQNGNIVWDIEDLTDWAVDTVNAVATKYWIRIRRTQVSLVTPPTEYLVEVINSNKSIDMPVVASGDAQIDKIRIFCSTLGGTILYWVKDVDNTTATINIDAPNASGYEAPTTYKVSPQAKYAIIKSDKLVIGNTDDDEIGSAVIRWSESYQPETFLETSFQVFDPEDGDEITGFGSILNYIVVFKANKMYMLDASSLGGTVGFIEISNKYGCIESNSIQTVLGGRALIYLSNEGFMMFDGKENISISEYKIDDILDDIDYTKLSQVKSIYNPNNKRYTIFVELYDGSSKWLNYYFKSGGWTVFDILTPNCFTLVKDKNNKVKIILGTSTTIAEMDYGFLDIVADIAWKFKTVEHDYGLESVDKVTRRAYLDWRSDEEITASFVLEAEYGTKTGITRSVIHAGTGRLVDRIDLSGAGKLFSFELSGTTGSEVKIYKENILYYPLSYGGVTD